MRLGMAALCGLVICALNSAAWAVGSISGTAVNEGEVGLEYKVERFEDDDFDTDNDQSHAFEASYGLSDWVRLEGELGLVNTGRNELEADSFGFEGVYQFTDPKEGWWLSSALSLGYVIGLSGNTNEIEGRLFLERSDEIFRHRVNLRIDRDLGGAPEETEFSTRVGSMYRVSDWANPAVEWQAEWGTNRDIPGFDEQRHHVGPGVYGTVLETPKGEIDYELAYLFGVTDASEDGVIRFELEYEFTP
jgi:hypothetical protein